MADMNGMSQELQRLVSKRMQAELQGLQIKFLMAIVAVLFALAAASFCQGWLKSRLNKDRRVRQISTSSSLSFSEVTQHQSRSQRMEQRVSPEPVERRSPNDRAEQRSKKASPAVRPQDGPSYVLSKSTRDNSLQETPLAAEIPADSSSEIPRTTHWGTNEIPAYKRLLRTASKEQLVRADLGRAGSGVNAPQTPIGRIGNGPIAPIAGAGRKTTDKRASDRDQRMARIAHTNKFVGGPHTPLRSASSAVNLASHCARVTRNDLLARRSEEVVAKERELRFKEREAKMLLDRERWEVSPQTPPTKQRYENETGEPQRGASYPPVSPLSALHMGAAVDPRPMRAPSSDSPISPLSALRMRAEADPQQQSQAVVNGLATPLRTPEGGSVTRISTRSLNTQTQQARNSSGSRFYANVVTKQVLESNF